MYERVCDIYLYFVSLTTIRAHLLSIFALFLRLTLINCIGLVEWLFGRDMQREQALFR